LGVRRSGGASNGNTPLWEPLVFFLINHYFNLSDYVKTMAKLILAFKGWSKDEAGTPGEICGHIDGG
jgi:hypothetical protein